MAAKPNPLSSKQLSAISIILVIFIVVMAFFPAPTTFPNGMRWIIIMILILVFLIVIGKSINGRALGVLINEYKAMSLSRLQIVIWTVIIVSAFFTIASARIVADPPLADPLGIAIDWRLWALLGISTTSLVGTPLILHDKEDRAKKKQGLGILNMGFTLNNTRTPQFSDIFKSDEKGAGEHVDMSKVQMFFFTIISALSYIVLLYSQINTMPTTNSLPSLPEGLIALLTISHGAYLTNKAVAPKP